MATLVSRCALIVASCAAVGVSASPSVAATGSFDNLAPNTVSVGNNTAVVYPSQITASGLPVGDVVSNATVVFHHFIHGHPSDLDALLVAPNGTQSVVLMSDAGGTTHCDSTTGTGLHNFTFDDAASGFLTDCNAVQDGTYKPTDFDALDDSFPTVAGPYGDQLADLDGAPANGVWQLYIVDHENNFAGGLLGGWTLNLTTVPAPANSGPSDPGPPTLAAGSVSPNKTGVFSLQWTASTDPDGDAVTYTLQHRDADDGSFSTVATGLTSPGYAFTIGSPEAEGLWDYRVVASDGTHSSGASHTDDLVLVDQHAPTSPSASVPPPFYVDPSDSSNAWYKDTATVTFTEDSTDPDQTDGSDGSGVDHYTYNPSNPATFTTSGPHTATGKATDVAGNDSTLKSVTVKVDADPPAITLTCPTTGVPIRSTGKTASWSASDGESGLVEPATGTVPLDTSFGPIGARTVSKTVHDNVGHATTATCTYYIVYSFNGFFRPLTGGWNRANPGQAIPIKFSLDGPPILNSNTGFGRAIFADPPTPNPVATKCPGSSSYSEVGTTTANASGLIYDPSADQYNYVWKTDKTKFKSGTCWIVTLTFNDGVSLAGPPVIAIPNTSASFRVRFK